MPIAIRRAIEAAKRDGQTYYIVPTRNGLKISETEPVGPQTFYFATNNGSVFVSKWSPSGRQVERKI